MKYDINPVQVAKIAGVLRKAGGDEMVRSFDQAVEYWNCLSGESQYSGDGHNIGNWFCRVDIFVDSARDYVVHIEVDAIASGLFFRTDVAGDIVVQEVTL